jgi:tetratricopeptide (TPR) repeat protein
VAKELARRLDKYGEQATSQDLTRYWVTLIAANLWVQNVSIVLRGKVIDTASLADPITPEERSDAEALKRLRNGATYGHDHPRALSMYSQAIKIDSGNAIYRSNRSAAYCALDQFEEAAEDAYIAVNIDPTYTKAWARLGMAYMKLNRSKKARKCYARAVELAGPDVTETMKRGLAEAEAKIKAALAKVADGDKVTQSRAGKAILDQNWDITLKTVRFHSLVHEQQVAGLVLFALQMNWPYIDQVRDCVDKLYSRILAGEAVSSQLQDWIYGVALPGKFLALTIMSALILCTPSISKTLKLSASWDWGLSLPQHSYWRTRTSLGLVLGALPGVKSLNGWIPARASTHRPGPDAPPATVAAGGWRRVQHSMGIPRGPCLPAQ